MTQKAHSEIPSIVFASNNVGKIREVNEVLKDFDLKILPQSDMNISEAKETGTSFVENAILKARNAARQSGLPAIADDSGIVVDALNGMPGIYSARFAGPTATDEQNLTKLIDMIKPFPDERRIAQFICAIVYLRHDSDQRPVIVEGVWEGKLVTDPRGNNGFGYDPIFYVPSHQCTAAELPHGKKNAISHRGQALQKLCQQLSILHPVYKLH